MNPIPRQLNDYEKRVIDRLLEEDFPGRDAIAQQIQYSRVRELDKHPCLEFEVDTNIKATTKFRVPTQGEFEDVDGVPISFLLFVDDNGQVNELEIYKADGSEIIRMPDPSHLKLFHPR